MGRPSTLRSAVELAAGKPHGTRIRYVGGCRCLPCRAANSRYESERQAARKLGDWNGLVDAAALPGNTFSTSRAWVLNAMRSALPRTCPLPSSLPSDPGAGHISGVAQNREFSLSRSTHLPMGRISAARSRGNKFGNCFRKDSRKRNSRGDLVSALRLSSSDKDGCAQPLSCGSISCIAPSWRAHK